MRGMAIAAAVVGFAGVVGVAGGQDAVGVVERPPTGGGASHYVGNRAPLQPSPLMKLPIGAIEPRGWLREQLELMREGMTGRLPELSHWVQREGSAWLSPTGEGKNGWEELPYWLKGYADLGYVLKDEAIIADAQGWMDGVMATRREDGYFGPESNRQGGPENMQLGAHGKLKAPDMWPHMPMLDALRSYHEATGEPRVLEVMTGYFKWQNALPKEALLIASWQKLRGGDNLDSVLWLYNRTGEAWLLELAEKLHAQTSPWSQKVASWHGVNICQGFREPAVYWTLSGATADLAAAERNYREVMGLYGQVPGGMFGSDEISRKGFGDPRQAAETCSMVEFMGSFQQLLRITGDGLHADRCEEVAFNSLPAAFTADYKALHYLTSPNMVQLDKGSKAPGFFNGGMMISYDPGEGYRCCQHNHAMGWPYYAEHLWMATGDGGLAATLYAASGVRAKVGEAGDAVRIEEVTEYPFGESVRLKVGADRPVRFPLYLRIPGWCEGAEVRVGDGRPTRGEAGMYVRVERVWRDGDVVEIRLPMRTEVKRWKENKDSASVRRGPLWYSLKIGEEYRRYGGTDAFPAHEVYATTPWNYGLVLDGEEMRVERGEVGRQPFEAGAAPVRLIAKGRRIPAWKQDHLGLVGLLQASPAKSEEPVEEITLIPMGAARLRISQFPVIGEGEGAHEWVVPPPPRHEASYIFDDINALSDGKEPRSSGDHDLPRFTWWNHLGTAEWVTYKLGGARRVSSVEVYWFDDTGVGLCRVPESWRLLYRDGDAWKEVAAKGGYGVEPDRYNRVEFAPVETAELRLEVKLRKGVSGGLLEWKVGG